MKASAANKAMQPPSIVNGGLRAGSFDAELSHFRVHGGFPAAPQHAAIGAMCRNIRVAL